MLLSYRAREYETLFAYQSHYSYISFIPIKLFVSYPQRILLDSLVVGGSSYHQLPVRYY